MYCDAKLQASSLDKDTVIETTYEDICTVFGQYIYLVEENTIFETPEVRIINPGVIR